ncbi:TetR/AcrR family transcriptional regulator [Microbacterium koreense]
MTEKKVSKKSKHLDAVIDQLMSTGINDLSLRELAAQIGTSHRVLIYHFTSKENLVNEVVHEVRRRERELFRQEEPSETTDLATALMAFFDHNISEGMRSYFRLFYEVWGIAQSKPEAYEPFLDGIVSVWVDSLAENFERAGYSPEFAVARATLVLATLRGLQLDLFTTQDEARVRAAFSGLVELIVNEARASTTVPLDPTGRTRESNTPPTEHHPNGEAP